MTVNDGTETVNQEFTITVANTNDAPVFTSTAIEEATEDVAYTYTATASDVDVGDELTFAVPTLPDWLTYDIGTQVLSGTPTNDEVGGHSVVLTVSDGFVTVTQEFTITVSNTNDAPLFTRAPQTSAVEDAE